MEFTAQCTVELIGAIIDRPCNEMLRIRRKWGAMGTLYRRALTERPYIHAITWRFKFQFTVLVSDGLKGNL